jgi:hypothetical protein
MSPATAGPSIRRIVVTGAAGRLAAVAATPEPEPGRGRSRRSSPRTAGRFSLRDLL